MKSYYVNTNAQSNGDHEVHDETCSFLPNSSNREYLGEYSTCSPAVQKAKDKGYKKANGCYYCSRACHTS